MVWPQLYWHWVRPSDGHSSRVNVALAGSKSLESAVPCPGSHTGFSTHPSLSHDLHGQASESLSWLLPLSCVTEMSKAFVRLSSPLYRGTTAALCSWVLIGIVCWLPPALESSPGSCPCPSFSPVASSEQGTTEGAGWSHCCHVELWSPRACALASAWLAAEAA